MIEMRYTLIEENRIAEQDNNEPIARLAAAHAAINEKK